jgi:hypothetical protein
MKRMSASAFRKLLEKRQFTPQSIEIAYRLLVQGTPARTLAREYGLHATRVYAIRHRVLKAYYEQVLPPGWVEATIAGPEKVIREFERQAAEVRDEWLAKTLGGSKPRKALS